MSKKFETIFHTDDSVGSSISLVELEGDTKFWAWAVYLNRLDLCIKGKKTEYYFKTRENAMNFFKEVKHKALLSNVK